MWVVRVGLEWALVRAGLESESEGIYRSNMPKKVEKRTHSEAFPEQEPEQQEHNEVSSASC